MVMYVCQGSCMCVRGHVCVLEVMYVCQGSCMCVRGICFYDFSIRIVPSIFCFSFYFYPLKFSFIITFIFLGFYFICRLLLITTPHPTPETSSRFLFLFSSCSFWCSLFKLYQSKYIIFFVVENNNAYSGLSLIRPPLWQFKGGIMRGVAPLKETIQYLVVFYYLKSGLNKGWSLFKGQFSSILLSEMWPDERGGFIRGDYGLMRGVAL